jgi:hypothetical protein
MSGWRRTKLRVLILAARGLATGMGTTIYSISNTFGFERRFWGPLSVSWPAEAEDPSVSLPLHQLKEVPPASREECADQIRIVLEETLGAVRVDGVVLSGKSVADEAGDLPSASSDERQRRRQGSRARPQCPVNSLRTWTSVSSPLRSHGIAIGTGMG